MRRQSLPRFVKPKFTSVFAIDFDGTLHDHSTGQPYPFAKSVMDQLVEAGAKLVIHTCRARPTEVVDGKHWDNSEQYMREWLAEHQIPYHEITATKPLADAYLDDKAITFDENWPQVGYELLAIAYQKRFNK